MEHPEVVRKPLNSQLRVALVVGELRTEASGVARIVCDLAGAQRKLGLDVTIYTAICHGETPALHLLSDGVNCVYGRGYHAGRLAYSPQLRQILYRDLRTVDIVHNQNLWMLPNHYAAVAAKRHAKPLIFTTMGFLEPWALAHSKWKKRLAGVLFQRSDLRRSACIHVNTALEIAGVRSYGLKNPVAVIPNGVNFGNGCGSIDREQFDIRYPELAGRRICLFLSRLHVKKGLAHLIQAWSVLARGFPDWCLVIAGPDDGYSRRARQLVADNGLQHIVRFLGPVYGESKAELLAAAEVFALPSFSEGFSMAILEAMAAGLPILLTPGCNFPEVAQIGAGIEVQPTVEETERGLRQLMELSETARKEMGRRGQQLVKEKYSWGQVAEQMLELYHWVLGGGQPPPFVELS